MTSAHDERSAVEVLADEFLARCKRGERPTIKEYCARHPDLADEIRDVFEAVLMVEDLKPGPDDVSGSVGGSAGADGKRLKQVGDYRILCEIGRGGMGVVYEAEQQALGRRVALKVLPKAVAGNGSAQVRFQREAKAAARMHHTNIVPVFDVGQDGEHLYYAMQLIHGQGLDLVIDDLRRLRAQSTAETATAQRLEDRSIAASLVAGQFERENLAVVGPSDTGATAAFEGSAPSSAMLPGQSEMSTATSNKGAYFRSVAQIGVQTASALSYAHGRGIVHRDIKPGNLILDTTGNVWVTDFGLAKTGDGDMTHTGDILGTVRYMSPERFKGQCDVRADVYALGMTLYELLTLKAAYSSGDRLKLIEMIRQMEAPSPRSIDPRIPRDLETIVMKAIDKDPKRRYQSADEMGEDLQRFVTDEPIKARRVGQVERFTRWCRRNPTVAGLTAAVLALMAAGTAVSARQAVVATQAREDLVAKHAELLAEQAKVEERNKELAAEEAKVQARFDTAVRAIETFHTGVSEDALLKNPQFDVLRAKLLKEATRFYDDLEALLTGQTDAKSRKTLANGYFQLGTLIEKIGHKNEALAVQRKALAVRRELAASPGADVETRLDVARSLGAIADLLLMSGDLARALLAYQEERDLGAALAAESPTDAVRAQLACGHNGIGFVLDHTGKLAEALESYRQALAIYQTLPETGQFTLQPRFGPAFGLQLQSGTFMSIGSVLAKSGKFADGLESLRQSSDILEKLAKANPGNKSVQEYLANGYSLMANLLMEMLKPTEALDANRKALTIYKKLSDDDPAVTNFHVFTVRSTVDLALKYAAVGRLPDAIKLLEEVLLVIKTKLPDHDIALNVINALDGAYATAGRAPEGIKLHEEMFKFYKTKVGPDHPMTLATMNNLATSYSAAGRNQEALGLREEALKIRKEKSGKDHPDTLGSAVNLAVSYRLTGRITEAIQLLEELLPVMTAKMPDHQFAFNCRFNLATFYADSGRTQDAIKFCEETVGIFRAKFGPDHPATLAALESASGVYLAVAAQHAWFGREREWAATCDGALALARDTKVAVVAERVAKLCSLRTSNDKTHQAALQLARRAVELGKNHPQRANFEMALGVAEYRNGHFDEADTALTGATDTARGNGYILSTSGFYRAMSRFREGKTDEARRLAQRAAAIMKPLPVKDDPRAPALGGGANADDLILWLAYKEAKDLIKFEAGPPPEKK